MDNCEFLEKGQMAGFFTGLLVGIRVIDPKGAELMSFGDVDRQNDCEALSPLAPHECATGLFKSTLAVKLSDVSVLIFVESRILFYLFIFIFSYFFLLAGASIWFYRRSLLIRERLKSEANMSKIREELAANEAEVTLARQVSHDIRSPLSALNLILGGSKPISDEGKTIVLRAVERINEIAQDLLGRSSATPRKTEISSAHNNIEKPKNAKTDFINVNNGLADLIAEKKLQYSEQKNVHIELDLDSKKDLIVPISKADFGRIISNLINNSVESFLDASGSVKVSTRSYRSKCSVIIIDTGQGIPPEVLEKLGQKGISFGKKGTSGTGLGVYHAKTVIQKMGGEIDFQSTIGQGTIVSITFSLK